MPIPPLTAAGLLPPGVHDCSLQEVCERFGTFQTSSQRLRLTEKLEEYIDLARRAGVGTQLYVDGSYVTAKHEPGDIDLLLILRDDFDQSVPVPPIEYNATSGSYVRKHFGFDFFFGFDGDVTAEKILHLFRQVKNYPGAEKGLLRVAL